MSRWTLLLSFVAAVVMTGQAHAWSKNYRPFAFHMGLSGAYLHGSTTGGGGAYLEPKLMLHDNISVSLRLDGLVTSLANTASGEGISQSVGTVGTVLAKGDFFLGRGTVRPFASLGLGLVTGSSVEQSVAAGAIHQSVERYTGFGLVPQIGVQLGRWRLAASYHAIFGGTKDSVEQNAGAQGIDQSVTTGAPDNASHNFFLLELGWRFGGGRR